MSKLEELIKDHGLIVECPRMLLELRMFQDTNEAATGYHDDWVMALAIGVTNIRFATRFVERLPVINPNQGHMASSYEERAYSPQSEVDGMQVFG